MTEVTQHACTKHRVTTRRTVKNVLITADREVELKNDS